jgi:hypothetical protein
LGFFSGVCQKRIEKIQQKAFLGEKLMRAQKGKMGLKREKRCKMEVEMQLMN